MNTYKTFGVCSRTIDFEVKDDIVTSVTFNGGCRGNTAGISKLAVGRHIDDIISLLEGIECRGGTSCPDQFAKALKDYKIKNNN